MKKNIFLGLVESFVSYTKLNLKITLHVMYSAKNQERQYCTLIAITA